MDKSKTIDSQSETDETKTVNKTHKVIKWSPENEVIMVEWCDVAQCYKWLNTRAHAKLSRAHAWFTIPAITLSTFTGTASFAQSSFPIEIRASAPAIIGTINICIGILSTIQQYLKISELNEAHRVSALSWDKFARNIRIELAKDPDERTDAGHFLKLCRMEFDRLMETSPAISRNIVAEFNSEFKGKAGSKERKRFEELRKPDICNTIVSSNESRHHWYKEIEHKIYEDDKYVTSEMMDSLRYKQNEEQTRIFELVRKDSERDEVELNETRTQNVQREANLQLDRVKLQKYINDFMANVGRNPQIDELTESMRDVVSKDAIESFSNVL